MCETNAPMTGLVEKNSGEQIVWLPVGYMYKQVSARTAWLKAESVEDIYSVSGCISHDFDDWINEWKHNGYWLFDRPDIMESIALQKGIDLSTMQLFFYRASAREWDTFDEVWLDYTPEPSFETNVQPPKETILEGYDVVSFSCGNQCECSPLSCNHLAESIPVNRHCLFERREDALSLLHSPELKRCEPGPYRLFEVHRVLEKK